MVIVLFYLITPALLRGGENKRLTRTATKTHWKLPFCIVLCSAHPLGSNAAVEYCHLLHFDDGEGRSKSLCKRRSKLLETIIQR